MEKLKGLTLVFLCLLGLSVPVFAEDPAAACGVMGCSIVVWLVMMVAILGVTVGLIVFIFKWIKKDATSRGMQNANSICWLALLGLMGLLIYVLTRPQGNTMPCRHCGLPRMDGLPVCPHCHQQ